jgi:hypothetical protein
MSGTAQCWLFAILLTLGVFVGIEVWAHSHHPAPRPG